MMEYERNPYDEILCLRAELAARDAKIEKLTAWISDLQSGMYVNCVYCGHRYGPGETTPVSMSDALKAHIAQCPEHPMSALRAENERLRAERDTWKGIAGEYSECLQDLCMTRLYDICRPVSHSWPGQKHVLSIRQAVDFLLERAEKAEAELAALRAERDAALVAVKAMHKLLDRDWAIVDRDITLRCESHDQAWNYLHEMRDLVRAALGER